MKKWETFEIKTTEFLNNTFSDKAKFTLQGGSDSTVPDILVTPTDGTDSYYVETKKCPAKGGQFVLMTDDDNKEFVYSDKNTILINKFSKSIINYMNQDFDNFKNADKGGKKITFPGDQKLFSKWIINKYKKENVRFFITNNNKVVPIEKFSNAFIVTAKYRIKRSGSAPAGHINMEKIISFLSKTKIISKYRKAGIKLFVKSKLDLNDFKFKIDEFEYMLSKRENEYEIRKLSNTYNSNVIFSVKEKKNYKSLTEEQFKKLI